MRIKRIEIISFGKFKNHILDFSDGFNLIFGKNEDGKSTIMAFISLMLYGTAGTSSRTDISGNFRKKYLPWSGEKMAGEMEIECGGRSYRIHKEFRTSSKTDKVTVIDTETGDALSIPPDTEIGKFFMGIDYNAFEKSVFGGTAESFAGTESGDIATRLSTLEESGDENISPKQAMARIDAAMDELVKKRSKGKINLAQDRVEELTRYIESVNSREAHRKILSKEYEKVRSELLELEEKSRRVRLAFENGEKERKAKAYRGFAELIRKEEEVYKSLSEMVAGGNPDEVFDKCLKFRNAVTVARDVLGKTGKPIDGNIVSDDDMRKYRSLCEKKITAEAVAQKKKKKLIAFSVFGGIFSALGIIGGILNPVGFLAIPVGISLFIPYLLNRKKVGEAEATERSIAELFGKCGCRTAEEFGAAYRSGIASAEKRKIYEEAKKECDIAERDMLDYVSRFGINSYDETEKFIRSLSELKNTYVKTKQARESYALNYGIDERNPEKLIGLAQDIEKEFIDVSVEGLDADKIDGMIQAKNEKLLELKGMLGAEPEDIAPAIKELRETQEKLGEMEQYYADLSLAKTVLLEAEDEMRRTFAPALKERATEILDCLTNGKYNSLSIDKTYEIEVKSDETGGYRGHRYLSRGTVAQSYLALRMALCEMLSNTESVPILLDDVLADYDDERATRAAKFLEEYAENGKQIIFFTCHDWLGGNREIHNILN